ncbi:MAG: protein phosphatase [Clostridiales bacterium]|nr:protein phosphatase [Clostridiales bacterium]
MNEELDMDKNMDEVVVELKARKTGKNQIRKILEILNDCKDLDEAKKIVTAMLEK